MRYILIIFERKIKKFYLYTDGFILDYVSSVIFIEKLIFKKPLKYFQFLWRLRGSWASQLTDIPETYQ